MRSCSTTGSPRQPLKRPEKSLRISDRNTAALSCRLCSSHCKFVLPPETFREPMLPLPWHNFKASPKRAEMLGRQLEIPPHMAEQLGLRLVSSRGPIDVVVIDHVEPPSEN